MIIYGSVNTLEVSWTGRFCGRGGTPVSAAIFKGGCLVEEIRYVPEENREGERILEIGCLNSGMGVSPYLGGDEQAYFQASSRFPQFSVVAVGSPDNVEGLRRDLFKKGVPFQTNSPGEVIAHIIARTRRKTFREAILEALKSEHLRGDFACLIATPEEIFGFCGPDSCEHRLFLGSTLGFAIMASDRAILKEVGVGAPHTRMIEPGCLEVIQANPQVLHR